MHQQAVHSTMKELERNQLSRQRRGLVDFVFGAFAGNVVSVVLDRLWPHELPEYDQLVEHERGLDAKIKILNARANFSDLQLTAVKELSVVTASLVEHNIEQIKAMRLSYPILAVTTSNIIAKMHLLGAHIERALVSFRLRKPDLEALYSIFKYEPLLELDSESIIAESVRISSTHVNFLGIEFTARRKSVTTKVYQVSAFRHWRPGATGGSEWYEYIGPRFVVFNQQLRCAKGLVQLANTYVTAQCNERGYTDHRLASWKEVMVYDTVDHGTEVVEAWPNIFMYCHPQTIKLRNETRRCPRFPFKLGALEHWSTPSFDYLPSTAEMSTVVDWPQVQEAIEAIHLGNRSGIMPKSEALEKLVELGEQVRKLSGEKEQQRKENAMELDAWETKYKRSYESSLAMKFLGNDAHWSLVAKFWIGVALVELLLLWLVWRAGARLRWEHARLQQQERDRREQTMRDSRRKLQAAYSVLPMLEWGST